MLQKVDQKKLLTFVNFIEEKGDIWFWATNYNALFSCPIEGGIAQKICEAGNNKNLGDSFYSKIFKYENKIIGIPMRTDQIMIYDLNLKQVRKVDINIWDWNNKFALERGRFWDGVIYGHYIYIIGHWSSKVIKFDMDDESIVEVIDLYENLDIPIEKRFLCFKNGLMIDDRIVIPDYQRNQIFILNPDNMQFERYVIEKPGNGFSDIAYDGENIWLSPREKGPFVKWNRQKADVVFYDNYPAEFQMEAAGNISCMEYCNGKIWAMPGQANKVISIGKEGDKTVIWAEAVFNDYYEEIGSHNAGIKYLLVQKNEKILYSFCTESSCLLIYDTERGKLSEHGYQVSDQDYCCFYMQKEGHVLEEKGLLSAYIKNLTEGAFENDLNSTEGNGNIGAEIYQKIMEEEKAHGQ